ncbi:ATP-binding protein [Vibrio parahaemolyticus]|uniref:AAA family ATPase n=1 Tax=Vibrio parahaemolyticus TaxID=670 RepID=UPI00111D6E79|nr:AAA family ATPase [Vibrio parahaemolyticus]TOJ78624.1 hypothetical protein CGI33_04495 [Vibrio parahaemolyticus]WMN98951.1 ATP-binding protein [Vibrio parahaemolyticus]
MKVDIDVKNFGKVRNAKIAVRPFTVVAGVNSSGKSFISRALYSLFNNINKDHFYLEVSEGIKVISDVLHFSSHTLNKSSPTLQLSNLNKDLLYFFGEISRHLNRYSEVSFFEQGYLYRNISLAINSFSDILDAILKETEEKKKYTEYRNAIDYIRFKSKRLSLTLQKYDSVMSSRISSEIKDALLENFQVRNLHSLKNANYPDEKTSFKISNLGYLDFDNDNVTCQFSIDGLMEYKNLRNVAFIESPMYWKLKPVLEARRDDIEFKNNANHFKRSEILTGVPQHFFDLVDLLEEKLKSNENDIPIDCFSEINDHLNGELSISDTGNIVFTDHSNGKSIGLHSTATGIANLGIISLLIKKGIINKGSFLFIDEPESNLHPAWQGVMIDTLFNLSLCGVNVVITTHSMDMIQHIENIVSDYQDDTEHFAINILNNKGYSIEDEAHLNRKISLIKEELGTPFFNSYMGNIW